MIGLVIVSHAQLALELLAATEMIIGPVKNARAVGIRREDSVEEIRERILAAHKEVGGAGEGTVIMTDMFGGTPANLSLALLEPEKVEVITGVNLPMVIKFFNSQEGLSLGELAQMLKAYGQQGISLASDFLKR